MNPEVIVIREKIWRICAEVEEIPRILYLVMTSRSCDDPLRSLWGCQTRAFFDPEIVLEIEREVWPEVLSQGRLNTLPGLWVLVLGLELLEF